MLIEYARRGAARVDDRAELVDEAGSVERRLTVVFMDVELAALRASFCRRFRLVDLRRNSVNVEDTREVRPPRPAPMIVIEMLMFVSFQASIGTSFQ
ncbi:hypothetical protein GCM10020255_067460 [Rhodococcus baikonurensis]